MTEGEVMFSSSPTSELVASWKSLSSCSLTSNIRTMKYIIGLYIVIIDRDIVVIDRNIVVVKGNIVIIKRNIVVILNSDISTPYKAVENFTPNRVLNQQPPEVSNEELRLPRKTRSTLAQLRSGWSKILNAYLHRINNEVENKCPDCQQSPHDVHHLFTCSAHPTNLTPIDLWVAIFLQLPTDETDGAGDA
ncbi:hypothetical protein M8J76_002264 [Diaphorina citri]|nr:hypothetical protein M8J76_002264 [Diaphorina citri]